MTNILLITADQWRGDCLSVLGYPCVQTPHLDALAAAGVCFRHHYAQAAPCGPSRACLFTGLYMHNHRSVRNGTPLDHRHTNLARELRQAGYDPVLFGYTDTSVDPRLFFDLQRDAQQLHNRAADPDDAVLVRDYAQKLLSWRMHHDERGLTGMYLGPGGVTTRWEARR